MKNYTLVFLFSLLAVGCGQKSQEHSGHEEAGAAIEASPNQALYEEVMKVHDEVMPKMNDIYKQKEQLKNKIAETPGLAEEKKLAIELSIARLDSANESMMVWMREFNPLPDSLGEEKAREYLENEMEKIKKVKDDVATALSEAAVN